MKSKKNFSGSLFLWCGRKQGRYGRSPMLKIEKYAHIYLVFAHAREFEKVCSYRNAWQTVYKARQNFDESSSRLFSYEGFSYKVVKLFFDQLHHVTTIEVSLIDALELMVFCNHQGQMDMNSEFETRLYQDLSDQILTKIKDSKELCFVWMFLRSRGPSGRDEN